MTHYRTVFSGHSGNLPPVEPFIRKYIDHLRNLFLQAGGRPENFPQYLKDSGCQMLGPIMKIGNAFMVAAKLTME